MRTDTCAHCGAKIRLVKKGPISYVWALDDLGAPRVRCSGDPTNPYADVIEERRHAPLSVATAGARR
jgi:hypothetical protein